jgi:ATP-dependent exoDNAse (exonuclease V) alpha subunit
LTLIGDFAQLPPINEGFAFESEYWPAFAENQITLTEIRRQTNHDFIEALQAVRRGDARTALHYFGHRFCPAISMSFQGVTVKAKNDDVDRFNFVRLEELAGQRITFTKLTEGTARGEWKQIPENLDMKIGALVMILANKRVFGDENGFVYVNGDLGMLKDADVAEGSAMVELLREPGVVVKVDAVVRANLKTVDGERRKFLMQNDPDRVRGKHEVIGKVTYTPLRAAYATSVHKSQGLSLDAVQVDIRNHFFSHPAMLYVALSRARTPEGLRLVGTPEMFAKRCVVDPKVQPFL